MQKKRYLAGCILILALLANAESRLEELKHRAEREDEQKRGPVYVDISREYVEMADHEFNSGDNDHAQSDLKEAVSYAEKAVASALLRGKNIKETEIKLRKVANRVEEVRRSVAVEQQELTELAHKRLEDLRTQLLNRMFGKAKS